MVLNAALAAAAGAVTLKACEYPDDVRVQAIISEQEDSIRKLTAESAMCMPDGSDGRDYSSEPLAPKDVEPPASVSDYDKLKNELIFHFTRSCQWGRDSVIVATRFRHSCEESAKLQKDIETKILHCDSALKLVETPEEKAGLEKAKTILEELSKNHHISPSQCPREPLINQ